VDLDLYQRGNKGNSQPIQPYDLVIVKNKRYTVKGCFNLGTWVSCVGKNFNIKKVSKVFHTGSIYLTQ